MTAPLGIHIAKKRVLDYLAANVPAYCAAIDTAESLSAGTTPVPKMWVQGPEQEPIDLPGGSASTWPLVFIDGTAAPQVVSTQHLLGGISYEAVYALRLAFFCRGNDTRAVDRAALDRDRIATALVWCLRDHGGFILPGQLRVLSDLPVELGDAWEDDTGHPMAAGAVSLTVRQFERVVRPSLTDPDATTADVTVEELTTPL